MIEFLPRGSRTAIVARGNATKGRPSTTTADQPSRVYAPLQRRQRHRSYRPVSGPGQPLSKSASCQVVDDRAQPISRLPYARFTPRQPTMTTPQTAVSGGAPILSALATLGECAISKDPAGTSTPPGSEVPAPSAPSGETEGVATTPPTRVTTPSTIPTVTTTASKAQPKREGPPPRRVSLWNTVYRRRICGESICIIMFHSASLTNMTDILFSCHR